MFMAAPRDCSFMRHNIAHIRGCLIPSHVSASCSFLHVAGRVIHHSDRGLQCTSSDFERLCRGPKFADPWALPAIATHQGRWCHDTPVELASHLTIFMYILVLIAKTALFGCFSMLGEHQKTPRTSLFAAYHMRNGSLVGLVDFFASLGRGFWSVRTKTATQIGALGFHPFVASCAKGGVIVF